ncbi:hypothetical protein FQN54_005620 [Arachnomyces sp. PD_36]|nr:hypothetical protein FQN54_005620 [Arachnomyces sp. PD_36]
MVQGPPDTHYGINNSWLRRTFTLASITLLRPFRPCQGGVLMLTSNICVKYGPSRHISEAEAMAYVARHTSIPVPRVLCAFQRGGVTYILMERIKGVSVGKIWASISAGEKESLRSQLRRLLADLRSLTPSRPGHIGDVNYLKLYDDRIYSAGFGPFTSSRDFHRFLRHDVVKPVKDVELDQLITNHEKQEYKTCFTHGDLSSSNILVRDGCVVGIIDWEMAGWYPEYWEYTSAWHVNPYDEWWRPEVENILNTYPAELEMESSRRKLFPMF